VNLPWSWPIEPEWGWPIGESRETIHVDKSRDGWVEITVGASNGFLPPDKAEEFIAAVRAALAG
jgi:hypothetical protein